MLIRNRTNAVYLNSIITLISQLTQIVLGFLVRKIFINYLGINYLGYNSVFSNILQMLNLADMGISVAVTSFLYKPLAENNKNQITAIMAIYKKMYSILGIFVMVVGLVASIFLKELIPDASCSIWYLRGLFYINLAGAVSTYFLAYKRTLLIADQKSYLANVIDTCCYFIISLLQILSLTITQSYIMYLLFTILKNIISNFIISVKVNKNYKYISTKADTYLINEYKVQIVQYVKEVFVSRIGAAIYFSTDNIILSVIKGSLLTGYLSNYTMITTQLNIVVTQVLGSVQATFGNFINTTENKIVKMKMTDNYFCVNFCIGNFCMICFSLLAQPFVKLFFGENMLLEFSTAVWLGMNLMLSFLIQLPSQVFVIYKLFHYDRPIIIVSAVLNILISVVLVNILGLNGVLIGTFITSLIYLFSRFYIIAKYVYKVNYWYYIKKIIYYGNISVLTFLITYFTTRYMNDTGKLYFGMKIAIVALLSVFNTTFFLSFSQEFDFLKNHFMPKKLRKYINKMTIGIGCVVIIIGGVFASRKDKENFFSSGNKSYIRNDSYIMGENTGRNVFHLSFDDTILLFKDLSEKEYTSIFNNPTLNWYKELHNKYGVVISCYVYFEKNDFDLTMVSGKFRNEFEQNSNWLRFGFHSLNETINYSQGRIVDDYKKTMHELKRIVGTKSVDHVVRLQMFQGTYEGIEHLVALEDESVVGLLTADDNRQSYYLSACDNQWIYCHDEFYDNQMGIKLYSTDFRIEYVDNIDLKLKELNQECWNNQTGDLVVFSHEWALNLENKRKIEKLCRYAFEKGYNFVFFEDLEKAEEIMYEK